MTDAIRSLFEMLTQKEKSGSDYTGTVTRVEGKTAYVRFDGADIDDTPVALSIGAKEGDTVRIRVADGRAWLVGNDSAPPNDSSGVAYDLVRTNALIDAIRTERITGENGWINLLLGTFNYGNGALKWNGSELSLNGKVIAKTGEIGDFTISGGALINENYIEISPYNNNQHSGYVRVSNEEGYSTSVRPGEVRVRNADGTIQNYLDTTGLHIKGNITVGNRQTNYNIIENGVALSDKYAPISSSDIRLKENIGKCEVGDALSVINQIECHSFDWRSDGEHQKIGFIADELEAIDERLTSGGGYDANGDMRIKSVNAFYLQGYEVKAIQELHARVKSLENEVAELKQMIVEMRKEHV